MGNKNLIFAVTTLATVLVTGSSAVVFAEIARTRHKTTMQNSRNMLKDTQSLKKYRICFR